MSEGRESLTREEHINISVGLTLRIGETLLHEATSHYLCSCIGYKRIIPMRDIEKGDTWEAGLKEVTERETETRQQISRVCDG